MSWAGNSAAAHPRGPAAQGWQPRGFANAQAPQAAPSGLKRPGGQVVSAPAKQPKAGAGDAAIVVFSTAEKDEIGIRTLVGEYSEGGTNHGRKYYKKTQKIPGHEEISVFLYYWDERDGPAFSGWWFGNQVGGAQVWSRNQMTSLQPPKSGWTIPWDGEVKKELVVMTAAEKQASEKKEAISRMEARKKEEDQHLATTTVADWEDRVQKATEKAADAEIDTTTALEHAKEVLQGDLDEALVMEAQKELMAQAKSLAETQRVIALEGVAAQKAPPALKAEMMALGERMRKLQQQVKDELQRLKNSKQIKAKQAQDEERRAEVDARERELEGSHSKQLEEMLPPAIEKVDAAEDEVEKVAIAAAPLQIDTADDLRPVMLQAIKETEQRVRAAQAAIGEARRYISGKLSQVGRFVSSTKKHAVEEFTALQTKLNEAQNKLTPFKTVRQDYEQRVQAKKLYEELSGKLAGAEIEVEKAAMMTAPLGGDTNEGIKETEAALSAAQSALSQCTRLVDSKMRSTEKTPGPLRDEIKALQERGKQAQEKLDEVRKTVKETQVRIAADTLLREVSEKVSNAEDELQKMAEAELPFLRGEKLGDDMDGLIAEADKVASKVHTAIGEAQTYVAKKLVEVARFTEGPAKTVKEEIDMLQKRLEEGRERLTQFRSSTADRKRSHLLEEVEAKVAAAEAEIQRLGEATESLSNIGAAGETVAEGLTETVENANLAERAAQASIVVARKHLLQKTAELKKLAVAGSGSGSELGKLQTRVNNMQQEITKLRSATKDAEERIRVKQMLSEVAIRLQSAEAEVEKVASVAVPLAQDQPSAEAVERMDKATTSANTKLSATAKLVDVKLKSATGFLKEELAGMRARISAAEKKLGDVVKSATEQKERLLAADLIAQAVESVEKAEAEVQKTSESELPFLKGIESLPATEASRAITVCETAAAGAQKAITDARTFVVQKLVEAKQFTEGPAESCTKELLALQKKLDAAAAKLAELKRDTAERKRKAQMQASGEKIAGVEAAVQKLADSVGRFDDEKLAQASAEEARALCEEIAQVEHDAKSAVADARKFLALRLQDAKSFSEAMRGPITADLTKLQSRLTQCQVELAKLSKQFTEREQRFVAKKLVEDAQTSLKQLQSDIESATKVVAPLLAEDKTELIKDTLVQALVVALHAYSKKTGLKAEGVFAKVSKGKTATAEQLSAFLDTLSEATGKDEAIFTDEQKAAIFAQLAKGGRLASADFQALLRERYICRESVTTTDALDDGKDVGVVEVGEGIEVIEEKDDKAGSKRARCLLPRDGSTAWATLADKEGALYFKASPPFAGKVESLEAFVNAVHARCSEASSAVDKKSVEVASVKQGPLADIKATLLQLRTKFSAEQSRIDSLKKRASAAKASISQQRKEELQKVQEAKCRALAAESVKEGAAAVQAAEERAEKATEGAKGLEAEKASVAQLEAAKSAADEALQALAESRSVVARGLERHEAYKGPLRNLLLEARVELTKLTSRATTAERKLRAASETVRTAHAQVVKAATKQAREVLRSTARSSKKSVDQLFDELSGGKGEVSEAEFQKFVKGLKGHSLKKEEVELVYKEFGRHGLRKPGFAKALQEFTKCEKDVAITDVLELSKAKTVRKLEQGELFEVLECPKEEPGTQVMRVRGRALRDSVMGWVTVKGNQGAPFLKPREKPFLWAAREGNLLEKFDEKSKVVRALKRDEVLELLEGPREASSSSEVHLKATACRDAAASGWITLCDLAGATFASLSEKAYVCRSTIAMTDVFDIGSCKVVRKVDVGEALLVVEGQEEQADAEKSIKRLKFRGTKDDKEGWVTLTGNQGTVYVEPSKSHYVVEKETAVRQGLEKDSAVVCQLKVGEVVEGLDAPKEIRPDTKMGVRARSLEDGQAGWVSFAPGPTAPVKPWVPKYTCKVAVALTPALAAKDADAIRQAEVGEVFEAVEGPMLDESTGLRRIRCATVADGVVGWATLRSAEGAAFLEV